MSEPSDAQMKEIERRLALAEQHAKAAAVFSLACLMAARSKPKRKSLGDRLWDML
jgi:hypothetical protein